MIKTPLLEKRPKFTQICIFYWNGCILVEKFHDKKDGSNAFRCPGGGLRYGESLKDSLRRVIVEQLGQGIKDIQALGIANSVFYWENELKHRVYMVYDAVFLNKNFYQNEPFSINIDEEEMDLEWKPLEHFEFTDEILYPQGLYEFLEQKRMQNGSSKWLIEP